MAAKNTWSPGDQYTSQDANNLADIVNSKADASELSSKADLLGGKLDPNQLPDLAIVQYLGPVASEAEMLTMVGQMGDWCIRTDMSTVWMITGSNPSSASSWTQLMYPTAPVSSVAGKTGAVSLSVSDVANAVSTSDSRLSDARPPTTHTHPLGQVDGLDDALAGKSNTGHTHAMGQVDGLTAALNGKTNGAYTLHVSSTAPGGGTPNTTITFVI